MLIEIESISAEAPEFRNSRRVPFSHAAVGDTGPNARIFCACAKFGTAKVPINGAGGSIGLFAVRLAKHFGAEVTAVDRADKLDMLRPIGADHVIDYQSEDFTRAGERYDVIIDVVGKSSFSGSINALAENGRYFLGNPRAGAVIDEPELRDLKINGVRASTYAPYPAHLRRSRTPGCSQSAGHQGVRSANSSSNSEDVPALTDAY